MKYVKLGTISTFGAAGAALRTVGASAAQSLGDAAYKTVTGQEIRRDSNQNKTIKFGQTFTDDGNNPQKANFDDMLKLGKDAGSTRGQKAAKKCNRCL